MNESGVKFSFAEKIKYRANFFVRADSSYHLLFWVALFVILTLLENQGTLSFRMLKEFINVLFFAAISYINILILFPYYLKQRNLIFHVILLIVLAGLITPIKVAALYLINGSNVEMLTYLYENMISVFFSSAFFGLVTTQYGIVTEWIKSQAEQKDLKRQSLESELKFLKSQINPHFLFNTLNSLYALTLKKSDLAPEIVLKLSEAMRYMLYECNEPRVLLEREIQYIENYLELERIRHAEDVHINFIVNGKVDVQMIAPLVFLPFVENSFKHGMNTRGEKYIQITLDIDGDNIYFKVTNNKGTEKVKSITNRKSGGFGLRNIKQRLMLLYPEKHHLKTKENEKDYVVDLHIEL